ncbi:hypothetical protein BC936DRAFT_136597 [Jimgerdemannia flammicorona]|uniref:UDP-N-acetylglucosamine transferase subunit ALG14 n=1 Tax=Jimgerdemannia flammicorona TaxID=994334 RepID=A0A433DJP9_9FUNG|nr:hypothetical protein BC936DRAFT_136597 [Jimgerdemannia flammicorona]
MWCWLLLFVLLIRIVFVLPKSPKSPESVHKRTTPCKIFVVLGSGGHTAEMLQLLSGLDLRTKYHPRVYVMAETDTLSEVKAQRFEKKAGGSEGPGKDFLIKKIPRTREVGQSWLTTPFSVLKALFFSALLVFSELPDAILCNGPGSCIPLCVLTYIPKILAIKHTHLIYVESFARVNSLSLTGKLLYRFVDRFLVQWQALANKYPRAEYRGVLV